MDLTDIEWNGAT